MIQYFLYINTHFYEKSIYYELRFEIKRKRVAHTIDALTTLLFLYVSTYMFHCITVTKKNQCIHRAKITHNSAEKIDRLQLSEIK